MGTLFVVDPIMTKKCSFQYSIKIIYIVNKRDRRKGKKRRKRKRKSVKNYCMFPKCKLNRPSATTNYIF